MSHGNALHNTNRFKLGLFGLNVDNACAITTIDGVFHPTWDNVKRLTRMADSAGFEALVPVARWRGFGGVTNFNGACFETFTWAAGVGGATDHAAVFATSHQKEYGRKIQVWANCYCVIGDTDDEALKFRDWYVREKGDWEAVNNLIRVMGLQSGVLPKEQLEGAKYHFIAGWGGFPLVGSPSRIADEIGKLASVGLDGALLSWPRYEEGLTRFIGDVLPLVEQAGLRKAFPVEQKQRSA